MILKDSTNQKWKKTKGTRQVKKRSALIRFLLLALLAGAVIGGMIASSSLKTKGYTGLWDFLTSVTQNYWNGRNANPEQVSIEIKGKDVKVLEKNREQALERGVIINDLDGEYVPATLQYKGEKLKVKLRLKGHMTDHLQDNKWSFRIKVNDKNTFMGMKRFSFQHPGTRGYIYEWIYHELMKREDVIALRYRFINVSVNGKDWGIYAVEENFEEELIANNKRPKGPILRFNPDLYWVDRYNEMKGTKPTSEFASYYSARVEAYRENKILQNTTQMLSYRKGVALMEGMRSRKIPVDEAMDIPRLARFHAIIDLVGGQQSMDWSDVKYYYNPVSAKLEPVAYESFTHFPSTQICGMYKYVDIDSSKNYDDWHQLLFSNPVFFKAYVRELERIAIPTYLDNFFTEVKDELLQNLAILNKEFPYKKFEEKDYYKNQVMITKMLDAPKSFHAYFERSGKQVVLRIGSIESLPVEIKSLQVGNIIFNPHESIILPSKQPNATVSYKNYAFDIPIDYQWNDSAIASMKVNYTVLGASEMKQDDVFPFPYPDPGSIEKGKAMIKSNVSDFKFLVLNESLKSIFIPKGKHRITSDMIIPAGYTVFAEPGVRLNLDDSAKIISYSPFIFIGEEDDSIIIDGGLGNGLGLQLLHAKRSEFRFVKFMNLKGFKLLGKNRSASLLVSESSVSFENCEFLANYSWAAAYMMHSDFVFNNCRIWAVGVMAIATFFSDGEIRNTVFEDCAVAAIDATMGQLTLNNISVISAIRGIHGGTGCHMRGGNLSFKKTQTAISSKDGGEIQLNKIRIQDSNIAMLSLNGKGKQRSSIIASDLTFENVEHPVLVDYESTVVWNGNTITADQGKK